MYAEDRGIPFVYKAVWRIGIGALCRFCLVFVPVSVVILPVAEPCFLGIGIHRFEVEGTVVGDETLEASLVVSGKIIYAEATEACAYSSETILVNKRQVLCCIINGRQIVFHTLSCPVAADFLVPF